MEKELNALTTSEFFSMLKNQKLYSLKEELMDTLIEELNKEKDKSDKIGQHVLSQKLSFLIDVTEKEKILFSKGYTEFIWHKDLTRYIKSVKPNVPTILDLEYYERTIPEINAADIIAAKDLNIFDRLIIVFNKPKDSMPVHATEVKIERERLRDPIVFGLFEGSLTLKKRSKANANININSESSDIVIDEVSEKLYYITSWDDDYCDLTLQKLMEAINSKDFKNIEPNIELAELIPKKDNVTKTN